MKNLRLLRDVPKDSLIGKRVLFRVDFEIPVENGRILDDFRIRAAIPTVKYLLQNGARILILTKRGHLEVSQSPKWSTEVLKPRLEELLGEKLILLRGLEELSIFFSSASETRVFLFENLRFWPEEEANNRVFAQKFASVADIYVSDNFGTAHRAHSSVAELPKLLPSYAGFLLEKEITALEKFTKNPLKPVAAILSGTKTETKLPLIKNFLKAGDSVLLGGVIANSVLWAKGVKFGPQCVDGKFLEYVQDLDLQSPNLYLPVDGLAVTGKESPARLAKISEIKEGECFLDAGPATVQNYMSVLKKAKTILWNGPLGVIEKKEYSGATVDLARQISALDAFKAVGGGDLISFLERKNLLSGFDHVSTGGGAMMEFLAVDKLPGIEALKDNLETQNAKLKT